MTEETITVWFPTASEKNPYHRLLFQNLRAADVVPFQAPRPYFFPLARTVLRNEEIDVIHFDWLTGLFMVGRFRQYPTLGTFLTLGRSFWFIIDVILVRLLGIKLVWTVHNTYHHERYYLWVEVVMNTVLANLMHALTVKCEAARQTISGAYRVNDTSKMVVIPDGNYIDAYPNVVDQQEARQQLGIGDEFVYLFFGLIRPYKNVVELIQAFQRYNDEKTLLWIVGQPKSDHIKTQLEALANKDDRVTLISEYVPSDEVQHYLNAADVLVFPYREILNSGSVHLGMSFAKPMIVPEMGCIPETLPREHNIFYDPDDPNRLLQALGQSRKMELVENGEANFEEAKSSDWSEIAKRYRDLYCELTE